MTDLLITDGRHDVSDSDFVPPWVVVRSLGEYITANFHKCRVVKTYKRAKLKVDDIVLIHMFNLRPVDLVFRSGKQIFYIVPAGAIVLVFESPAGGGKKDKPSRPEDSKHEDKEKD